MPSYADRRDLPEGDDVATDEHLDLGGVPTVLNRLDKRVRGLSDLLRDVEEKLGPIRRELPAEDQKDSDGSIDAPGSSPLTINLLELDEYLVRLCERVAVLRSSIDL